MATLENPFEKVRPKLVAARLEIMSKLAKFKADELALVPRPDMWSALRIAYHLYVSDGLALEQMRRVQEEENPELPDLNEETPRQTLEGETPTSLDAVLGGMAARRETIFEYLKELPPEAWERPFTHSHWGQLKFYQLVNVLPQHEQEHARQLAELKAAIAPAQS